MLLHWPRGKPLPQPPQLSARESARLARRIHHWHLQAQRGLVWLDASAEDHRMLYEIAAALRGRILPSEDTEG
jgi:hypothetical protein